ncbi:MAG: hypothetical protein IT350_17850 [Deltaproteobacteria bacterium]|nr:hypothetical protein [Deltaproteobacteria bacterium]
MRRVLNALAEAIIGDGGAVPIGHVEARSVDRAIEHLRTQAPDVRRGFVALAWFFEWLPVLIGEFSRFSRLSVERRLRVLDRCEKSALSAFRQIAQMLKLVIYLQYYSEPVVERALGIEAPCVFDPATLDRKPL